MRKLFSIIVIICSIPLSYGQWNTERIMNIGKNALNFEDYVLAIQYFNQVIKVKPYLGEAYMYRGIAKVNLGDYLGTEQDCTEAINRNPFLPDAYYARGFARKKLGKFNEAIQDFNKALEFSPENSPIIANRAEAKEKLKDISGAIDDLNLFKKLNPKEKSIDYEIGRILLSQNDTVKALKSFDKYIENDTSSALGYSARAMLRMQMKDEDGAYDDYNEAIKRKSKFEGDYINRGILNVKRNKFIQALNDYNTAIKLDSKNILAYYNRGLLRSNLGDDNNAIGDLDKVVTADSTNYEARLQKAYLELKVGDLNAAVNDYQIILKKYPFFVPAYFGIAEAKEKAGKKKEAVQFRNLAAEISNNKDYYKKKQILVAKNQMVNQVPLSVSKTESTLMEKMTVTVDNNDSDNKYSNDPLRGNIQDKNTDLKMEPDYFLSYYSKSEDIRRTNTYHPLISNLNGEKILPSELKITKDNIALVPEMLNTHFESISVLTKKIEHDPENDKLYFARSLDFALVKDYASALDDLNKAILLNPNFALAYFTRANLRYQQIKYQQMSKSVAPNENNSMEIKQQVEIQKIDYTNILEDYGKAIKLSPDLSFAYYNKGNVLSDMNNFKESIANYSKAIEIDPDFAEAYYNRGLTYLKLNDKNNATINISKAGELGIFQSYNILKRLQE